jgi:DNA-binding NarL/FixJ family response regulator
MAFTSLLVCEVAGEQAHAFEDKLHCQPALALVATVCVSDAPAALLRLPISLVWIELSGAVDEGLALLTRLRADFPEMILLVSCAGDPAGVKERAIELGAYRYISDLAWAEDSVDAVASLVHVK